MFISNYLIVTCYLTLLTASTYGQSHHNLIGPCLNEEKLCFGLPSQCTSQSNLPCKLLVRMVSMANPKDGMIVEMFASNREPGRWFALGLSTDTRMGDDIFVHCDLTRGGQLNGGEAFTRGHSGVSPLTKNTIASNLTLSNGDAEPDGYFTCRWNQKANSLVSSRVFNILDNNYHILLAHGPLEEDDLISYHDERSFTPNPVSLQSVGIVLASQSTPTLVRLHGSLMIIAWTGLVSLAIMIARHYKESWAEKSMCGVKIWFVLHRSLMIFAVIFAILGVISIFVHVGSWRGDSLHQYFGLISSICMMIQPLGALFRCSPGHPKRGYFDWIHWAIGNTAYFLAMATIFSVIKLKAIKLPDPFYWLLAAHLAIYVLIHIIMQIHGSIISSKKKAIEEAHESLKSFAGPAAANLTNRIGEGFKQFMLGLYMVIIVVSTLTMVLIVIFQGK